MLCVGEAGEDITVSRCGGGLDIDSSTRVGHYIGWAAGSVAREMRKPALRGLHELVPVNKRARFPRPIPITLFDRSVREFPSIVLASFLDEGIGVTTTTTITQGVH